MGIPSYSEYLIQNKNEILQWLMPQMIVSVAPVNRETLQASFSREDLFSFLLDCSQQSLHTNKLEDYQLVEHPTPEEAYVRYYRAVTKYNAFTFRRNLIGKLGLVDVRVSEASEPEAIVDLETLRTALETGSNEGLSLISELLATVNTAATSVKIGDKYYRLIET